MEKSNIITRIIKKFLSGRFSVETEEKVQRWIMKEENAEERKSLIRVLERTGYGSRFKNIQCFRAGQFKNRIQQRTS